MISPSFALSRPQLVGSNKQPIAVSVLYPKQWTVTKTPGVCRRYVKTRIAGVLRRHAAIGSLLRF